MTGQSPAGYSRAAGIAALIAFVVGAQRAAGGPGDGPVAAFRLPVAPDAQEALTVALEAAYGPDLVVAEREGHPRLAGGVRGRALQLLRAPVRRGRSRPGPAGPVRRPGGLGCAVSARSRDLRILAVVGTRMLAHPADENLALRRINLAIERLRPHVVMSGDADGVDTCAAFVAQANGYSQAEGTLVIHRPTVKRFHGPGGYRERDERIATECTHLLRLACQSATTYGSGWTADRAQQCGAIVVRHLLCGPGAGDQMPSGGGS